MAPHVIISNSKHNNTSKINSIYIAILSGYIVLLIALFSIKQSIQRKISQIELNQSKHLSLIEECKSLSQLLTERKEKKQLITHEKTNLSNELTNLKSEITSFQFNPTNTIGNDHYKTYFSKQYYQSSILTENNFNQILSFITDESDITSIDLTLQYKSTIHGDTKSSLFKCIFDTDKILMLIKLNDDSIIGGYSSIYWDWTMDEKGFYDCNNHFNYRIKQRPKNAFLFSLKEKKKYPIKNSSEGIVIDMNYFFTFNRDLEIKEGFLSEEKNYSMFPNKYTCIDQNAHCNDFELTSGWREFQIKEIEVFKAIKTIGFYDKIIGV